MKPIGRWTRRVSTIYFSPKIGLETNDDRAIDLSCRACGAGAWALGLDSRLGTPASLPFSPPTPDIQLNTHMLINTNTKIISN